MREEQNNDQRNICVFKNLGDLVVQMLLLMYVTV